MKQLLLLTGVVLTSVAANAQQQFAGYRTSNYTGATGMFFNPASLADSRHNFDFNLISLSAGVGNNNAAFSLKNIKDVLNGDDLKDIMLTSSRDKATSGLVNMDILGPAISFKAGKKVGIGFSTRVRTIANITDIDGGIVDAIDNNSEGTFPFSLNSSLNQRITANAWAEIGASAGIVLLDHGHHFLKAGVTVKYLGGAANTYVNVNRLNGTIDQDAAKDVYLSNTSGGLSLGYAGFDLNNFDIKDALKFNSSGIGGDIGFVYEYRPDYSVKRDDQNKYKFKVGVSLLDIGKINYKSNPDENAAYSVHINGGQRWYPSEIDGESVGEIKEYFDGHPQFFTNEGSGLANYKAGLPTTLQAHVDFSITNALFIDVAGQFNLAKNSDRYSAYYQDMFTVTPRFEGKAIGLYMPISYNKLTEVNAGFAMRLGPLFFGSGSLFTALLNDSKQADVFLGLRFGSVMKKKKYKSSANELL